MATRTLGKRLGDGLKWEVHPGYTRKSGTFRNNSGSALSDEYVIFQPVKLSSGKWVPVLATDEANAGGLLLIPDLIDSLANNTDYGVKAPVLVKGPLIFNKNSLPAADVAGTSFTIATLVTALEAKGFVFVDEPSTVETQTT